MTEFLGYSLMVAVMLILAGLLYFYDFLHRKAFEMIRYYQAIEFPSEFGKYRGINFYFKNLNKSKVHSIIQDMENIENKYLRKIRRAIFIAKPYKVAQTAFFKKEKQWVYGNWNSKSKTMMIVVEGNPNETRESIAHEIAHSLYPKKTHKEIYQLGEELFCYKNKGR